MSTRTVIDESIPIRAFRPGDRVRVTNPRDLNILNSPQLTGEIVEEVDSNTWCNNPEEHGPHFAMNPDEGGSWVVCSDHLEFE